MTLMMLSLWLNGLNLLLVGVLLARYVRIWVRMRSSFTFGLVLFAALFLIQNAVSFYYAITMMAFFAQGLQTYALVFNALQTVAFGILNYITLK